MVRMQILKLRMTKDVIAIPSNFSGPREFRFCPREPRQRQMTACLGASEDNQSKLRGNYQMRNMNKAFLSGLGIIALLLTLTPDPVAAARGGARGAGMRSAHVARGAVTTGGFRRAAVVRPGVRPGWTGRRAMAGVAVARPGWGPGWGGGWGGGWGWPVAAGVAAGVAATSPWGWGNCTRWNGFAWVNVCSGSWAATW